MSLSWKGVTVAASGAAVAVIGFGAAFVHRDRRRRAAGVAGRGVLVASRGGGQGAQHGGGLRLRSAGPVPLAPTAGFGFPRAQHLALITGLFTVAAAANHAATH